ncbi:hypothetical protein [Microbacterium sp. A93]|uniref:hypothetical protein n=1 Tax=Microbacterium sp. A93 TaxID=3450716 RepID=UPI003F443A72
MRPRIPLPRPLKSTAFQVQSGSARGLGEKRMRGHDLQRPFHGVRAAESPESLSDRCAALSKTLQPHHVFSHRTAAEIWRMPLPADDDKEADDDDVLHVMALGKRGRIRRPGVVGWERTENDLVTYSVGSIHVCAPADVWCQLSTLISREWLVAVGDFLISGERDDDGRRPALCTMEQLSEAIARHGRRRGVAALQWALGMVRSPVDSPRESLLRLALVAGGLPEPEVQLAVQTTKGIRHGDLGYRDARLIIEYQGDEHRTSRRRWLQDLTRVQLLEDAGYRVILVGADDLEDGAEALIGRIRRILASAG